MRGKDKCCFYIYKQKCIFMCREMAKNTMFMVFFEKNKKCLVQK
jgi:hypothetical protein